MPNHIKNRLTLSGSRADIDALVSAFSTHHEQVLGTSHDGNLRYKNQDGGYGFLNQTTNVFWRRGEDDVVGIPDGYVQDFEEAWTQFPDFEKIMPRPEGLDCESGSVGDTAYHALFGDATERFQIQTRKEALDKLLGMEDSDKVKAIELGVQYAKNVEATGHKTWYSWNVANWGTKWNAYSCEKLDHNVFEFETAWSAVVQLIEKISRAHPLVEILYEWSSEDTGANCGVAVATGDTFSVDMLENGSKEAYELAFKLRPDYREYYALVGDTYEYIEED